MTALPYNNPSLDTILLEYEKCEIIVFYSHWFDETLLLSKNKLLDDGRDSPGMDIMLVMIAVNAFILCKEMDLVRSMWYELCIRFFT